MASAWHQGHRMGEIERDPGSPHEKTVDEAMSAMAQTALYFAAEEGHLEVVRALISAGADKGKACISGATPLTIAQEHSHITVVEALQAADALS